MSILKVLRLYKILHILLFQSQTPTLKTSNFLIPSKLSSISKIKKIINFVDNIEKGRVLAIFLQIFLLDKLKNRDEDIIKSFSLILEVITKTNWLKKFLY